MYNVTQKDFEEAVPAMKQPDDRLFLRVKPEVERVADDVAALLDGALATAELERLATLYIATQAARNALPHLDLVATPTGFGIVSNQNIAPASRERVQALDERLRRDASTRYDRLIISLLGTPWSDGNTARRLVCSLLWCPTLAREYGVSYDGERVYGEEFDALAGDLAEAETEARRVISPELYDALCVRERSGELPAAYALVLKKARRLIGFLASRELYGYDARRARMVSDLNYTLQQHVEELPEYKGSSTYRQYSTERYRNARDHGTFFFH